MKRERLESVANPCVKKMAQLLQKKYRQESGDFLVEGLRAVEEAVDSARVKALFFVQTEDRRTLELLDRAEAKGVCLYQTNALVIAKLCDTMAPQGMVACVQQDTCTLKQLAEQKQQGPVVVVDRLQDPGNMGTLIRTADAVGAAGIILLQGTVDVFSPKVVRSSMGSLFHVKLCGPVSGTEMTEWCREQGYRLAATTLENSRSIYDSDLTGRLALIIGNEANGVSNQLLQQAELQLHIPMPGRAESLNAAQAAGIILFESMRQSLSKR
jgi:TrmH family RNA methyltransferase